MLSAVNQGDVKVEQFTIEIAGVPIEIKCLFSENREFLRDYISEKAPLLSIP